MAEALPLVDTHVHLLAGLDDGPRTPEDALAMCRAAAAEGTRLAASLAHQNERYTGNTPDVIRAAVRQLAETLAREQIELEVVPCAEVMARPDLIDAWRAGELLSVADRRQFLLLEMPHDLCIDLTHTLNELQGEGLRLILAHPERTPELLHDPGKIEGLISRGCLVQVSSKSITDPPDARTERAVRDWVRRGVVHLIGSDGHSVRRRPPRLAAAVQQLRRWAGEAAADRIGSTYGQMVLRGLPVKVPPPQPPSRRWWALPW